ncbi:UDP-N-acetylglucosamine--N-acetylmuramyl-(pentapeptide) pyrophosphoryl-undecaprenol N-acetylglucosaminetransferase [Striga asiatica]|uniref:UDP-N-acetylglucosamine--N-acetylmuramyl-(Pentapeptide) pyrophosphoryl-undecaprenol N-acetylglucosaminetransferase n=1 Tax=Striga asiatica TaxID=4170 RepID=A0A5A7PAN7_STRAF|nr:UDP-N-acetylglucosamine--N-acetylmuramyl-(pentapeptide) pyrophosphoryl-undecaprenol N-acetylglucosaminetransferase [Striga asiatica]
MDTEEGQGSQPVGDRSLSFPALSVKSKQSQKGWKRIAGQEGFLIGFSGGVRALRSPILRVLALSIGCLSTVIEDSEFGGAMDTEEGQGSQPVGDRSLSFPALSVKSKQSQKGWKRIAGQEGRITRGKRKM